MRVLLVRPQTKKLPTLGDFMFNEPLGLECVYAVLKGCHQVRILDLMVGEEDFLEECRLWQPEVIGFTSLCINVLGVLELAQAAKGLNKDIVTVVGGTQAYLSPEGFFRDEIDYVMKYTTVNNILELFTCLERGGRVPLIDGVCSRVNGFKHTGLAGFNDYIIPDRTSTERYRKHYSWFAFRPCGIIETSRGCSACCSFCLRWKLEGRKEKDVPLENVIEQIRGIKEPYIMIIDNNFLHNPKRVEEFCDLLESHQINKSFFCYGSAESIANNPGTVSRLAANGFKAMIVGFESFKETDLRSYHKKATVEQNIIAGKHLKESHIDCWASFILHPDWDSNDFRQLRKYIKLIRPEYASLTPLTPFPGGPLYKKYADRVIVKHTDYNLWNFSIVTVRPSKMSLQQYYFEVVKINILVNMLGKNPFHLVRKYGYRNLFKVFQGSLRFLITYIRLMLKG